MKIQVRQSATVRPAASTPCTTIRVSNLDTVIPKNLHGLLAYFYRYNGSPDFFNSTVLKAALSHALVHFYPVAGRLRWNNNDDHRMEINCNAKGVLFLDAESDGRMDDLEDLSPKPGLDLVPKVDYSLGISTVPIFLVQVTRFKCGGVCLGTAIDHHVCDASALLHFMKSWSDIARGLDITIPPFLDRRVLSARNPPQPQFTHIEYQPLPTLKISQPKHPINIQETTVLKRLILPRDQINALKSKCKENDGNMEVNYSRYEVVAGHSWRCMTAARKLPEDQVTKLTIVVNGRSRMRPPLPQGYFGNALFFTTPIATAGQLLSKPLKFIVGKIHDAIARIDHDYMISALDYLETCDLNSTERGAYSKSPNIVVTNWGNMAFYQADFGWGRPVYVGPGAIPREGKIYVMDSPAKDGSLWLAVALLEDQMKLFEKALYGDGICRSKI